MKKNRQNRPTPERAADTNRPAAAPAQSSKAAKWWWLGLFLLVLAAGIGLKIFKGYASGITYDEAFTYANFGQDVAAALNYYRNPNNNHVINSLLICVVNKYFHNYEHFIRIPSVISGVLFSLALAVIVWQVIRSNMLKVVILAAVSLNAFAFDLSFLARGYSHALAAIYWGIALVIWLLKHPTRYRNWPIVLVALAAVNLVAFGSMLSCFWVLAGFNLVVVLVYSSRIYQDGPPQRYNLPLHALGITALSGAVLFALYHGLYRQILAAKESFGNYPFGVYMKQLLWDNMVNPQSYLRVFTFYGLIGLIAVGLTFYARYKLQPFKTGKRELAGYINSGGGFIVLVTVASFLVMFLYRVVLKLSIGFPRNGVFLLPLVLLTIGLLTDRAAQSSLNKHFQRWFTVMAVIIFAAISWQNLPDSYAVQRVHDWHLQSLSGPLLRRLKAIDDRRNWNIAVTYETRNFRMGAYYYQMFGYHFSFVGREDYDVVILLKTEKLPGALCLDRDFFQRFNCQVIVNPRLAAQAVFAPTRLTRI